jgi:hypothetical protein
MALALVVYRGYVLRGHELSQRERNAELERTR